MSIAAHLKEIGRGKQGARSLDAVQAYGLFSKVLDRSVTDLEVGAFALAMRIKGETAAELQGFVKAAHERCLPLPLPVAFTGKAPATRGGVILPSYNGARKLPNLTALLAMQLAKEGMPVLVHGPLLDPARVTTAEIWQALQWPIATQASDITQAWAQHLPVFMPINCLCPSLSALLDIRWTIGLRNPGHTVAKLLCPWPESAGMVQVVNHTHPEFSLSLAEFLKESQRTALLLRGTEGEPVADARRQPRFDVFMQGERNSMLSSEPQQGALSALPILAKSISAEDTAHFIEEVLSGSQPMPASIAKQVQTLTAMHLSP